MAVSQQIPVPRGTITPDHESAASFLSSVRGHEVSTNSPFVTQLVAMLESARAEERLKAAIRADEDRARIEQVRASMEYRHPQGRYGPDGWLS